MSRPANAQTLRKLRSLTLEVEAGALILDSVDVLGRVGELRREVVDTGSEHGIFRQLFDARLRDAEGWARHGDFDAVCSTVDDLRALLGSLETSGEACDG